MNPILKRTITGIAIGAAVIAAILLVPPAAIPPAVACLIALASVEYVMLLRQKFSRPTAVAVLASIIGIAVLCCLWSLALVALRHGNLALLYVVAVVKFSDVGGFAFGLTTARLMEGGNHKMCPSVSPAKSWEGLLGSVVLSCAVSCAFMPAMHFALGKAIVLGVVAAIVGTAGDLVESKFKRYIGVKDSSAMKITNGMGGILDMFDSLLFAPAVILCLI